MEDYVVENESEEYDWKLSSNIRCICGNVQNVLGFDKKTPCEKCGCQLWVIEENEQCTPWIELPDGHPMEHREDEVSEALVIVECHWV